MKSMKKIFTILLTISVLGANAQETETITSLGNYKAKNGKTSKSSKKINWIYQFQNTSSYDFGLSNSITTFSGGTDFFNNPNINDEQLYGAISKYYKDVPKTFEEALDFNQSNSGDFSYRFNTYDFINDDYQYLYSRNNLNLINLGVYVPISSWYGIKSVAAVKRYQSFYGYNLSVEANNRIETANIGFIEDNTFFQLSAYNHLQTPFLLNRIGFFVDAGISFLQGINGKITETGNSTFNYTNASDIFINNTYKLKKRTTTIGFDLGAGPQFKINENLMVYIGFNFPAFIAPNSVAPEYLNETSFGVNFNF